MVWLWTIKPTWHKLTSVPPTELYISLITCLFLTDIIILFQLEESNEQKNRTLYFVCIIPSCTYELIIELSCYILNVFCFAINYRKTYFVYYDDAMLSQENWRSHYVLWCGWDTGNMTQNTKLSMSFGNPRLIPWPTSRLGCTIVLDMCLRSTFCDAVVLYTVLKNLRLLK